MAKVALLIGVSEYEPGLNPLPGSVKDVDAMQRVLAHPEMGGFAEADITVLKNPQRQAMEDAIYLLFSSRKKDDLLLFYFSGHGIKDENGRLYLATRATRKDSNGSLVPPSAVAAASLHENINASRSQRQVMILDCCFSGAISQGMTVKDDGAVNLKDYLGGKGRAILTSSTSTEYSFGSEAAEHEDAGLSIYTRYLVEGIETGAADVGGDGWIAVEELHEYAASRVKEAAPAMTPKFYPVEEGYKIVLSRSRKDDPKLKYRKEVQASAEAGQGRLLFFAQKVLEGKRDEWGITAEEAKTIEAEVLEPYRKYERNLQEYEQALTEAVQIEYPFSPANEAALNTYQQQLGLRDSDIAAIETRVLAPLRAEYERQQQEAKRLKQEQAWAEYENRLRRYEEEFTKAIVAQYPIDPFVRDELNKFQQSLELTDEDVAGIEAPIVAPKEAAYQQRLAEEERKKEEAERQRELERQQELERQRQEQLEQEAAEKHQQAEEQERQRREAEQLKRQQAEAERLRQEEIERQQVLEQQRQKTAQKSQAAQTASTDELASEKGINYTKLRNLLKAQDWKAADRETADRMLEVMGQQEEGYLSTEDTANFPCADLRTIDQLWVKHSQGQFGFSVQKKIWQECGSPTAHNMNNWEMFGEAVGWKEGFLVTNNDWKDYEDYMTFDTSAPAGHFPTAMVMVEFHRVLKFSEEELREDLSLDMDFDWLGEDMARRFGYQKMLESLLSRKDL